MRQVFRRALALRKAKAEGKLGEDYDAFSEKLLRVDTQAGHNPRVLDAVGVSVQDLATSTVRAGRNVAAFRDRTRAQKVDNASAEGLGEGMTVEGIALANAAKASILSSDKAIRPSGISPEALVAAENVLGTGPATGFGQPRRD